MISQNYRRMPVGASIEAPISGTITSVTVKAGDEAQPDTALVTMQPEGKGFTMSFSVTNDQRRDFPWEIRQTW